MSERTKGEARSTASVVKGLVAGVAGGFMGALVMSGFQAAWTAAAESVEGRKKKGGSSEEPANVKTAEAISENLFDHKLKKSEKEPAGTAVHYAMGATSGAIYGVLAEVAPFVTVGTGAPFGAAVWLVADEVTVPALGFAKPPAEVPASTHVYALASHIVYGVTTDLVRRAVRKVW